jgi:hypothetical protein
MRLLRLSEQCASPRCNDGAPHHCETI